MYQNQHVKFGLELRLLNYFNEEEVQNTSKRQIYSPQYQTQPVLPDLSKLEVSSAKRVVQSYVNHL
jgi:hypothetical protein